MNLPSCHPFCTLSAMCDLGRIPLRRIPCPAALLSPALCSRSLAARPLSEPAAPAGSDSFSALPVKEARVSSRVPKYLTETGIPGWKGVAAGRWLGSGFFPPKRWCSWRGRAGTVRLAVHGGSGTARGKAWWCEGVTLRVGFATARAACAGAAFVPGSPQGAELSVRGML